MYQSGVVAISFNGDWSSCSSNANLRYWRWGRERKGYRSLTGPVTRGGMAAGNRRADNKRGDIYYSCTKVEYVLFIEGRYTREKGGMRRMAKQTDNNNYWVRSRLSLSPTPVWVLKPQQKTTPASIVSAPLVTVKGNRRLRWYAAVPCVMIRKTWRWCNCCRRRLRARITSHRTLEK